MTAITGDVHQVDSGVVCHGDWTYPPDLDSGHSVVDVRPGGRDAEVKLAFKGVAGSTFPDGLEIVAQATAEGGHLKGEIIDEETGTTTSVDAAFDGNTLEGTWSQHQLTGDTSACRTELTAGGTFTATPPARR